MSYSEIKAVKGVRNEVSPDRFGSGDLTYARNVDIDKTGRCARRLGSVMLSAGTAHSAFSYKNRAYFVQGGALRRFTPGEALATMATVTGARVAYVGINDDLHWSDGVSLGIVNGGLNRSWGVAPPAPLLPASTLGSMTPGTYLCSMTFVDVNGIESGAPVAASVIATGGITFANLPVSASPEVRTKNIYISACDGDILFLAGTFSNGTTTATFTDGPAMGAPLRTQFMGPPPPGQVLGFYNGRAYVASGQFLWYSLPYQYTLFDQRSGFIPMPEAIQTFAAVNDGIFVGTTQRTVFLKGGGPEDFDFVPAAPVGTIMGTEVEVPANAVGNSVAQNKIADAGMVWTSTQGAVLGLSGGALRDLTADRFIPPSGLKIGGALFKIRDGIPQYVVSLSK